MKVFGLSGMFAVLAFALSASARAGFAVYLPWEDRAVSLPAGPCTLPPFQRSCVVRFTESAVEKMRQITAEARRRGKVCGLFESGAIGGALPDYYDWLHKALTADGVGFAFVNMWGGYEIPRTPEGKECLKRFLARPEVVTFRDGIDLASPMKSDKASP